MELDMTFQSIPMSLFGVHYQQWAQLEFIFWCENLEIFCEKNQQIQIKKSEKSPDFYTLCGFTWAAKNMYRFVIHIFWMPNLAKLAYVRSPRRLHHKIEDENTELKKNVIWACETLNSLINVDCIHWWKEGNIDINIY